MSLRLGLLLAVLVFLGTVIAQLPARLVVWLLPSSIRCEMPGGTLWHGGCAQVRSGALSVMGVRWALHPLALLRGQVSADVICDDSQATMQGEVELWRGHWGVRRLSGDLELQPALGVPAGWSGTLRLALGEARVQQGHVEAIAGEVRLQQLRSASLGAELGSYDLRFPPTADATGASVGELRDLAGPLSVDGQLRLSGANYQLSGTLAVREGGDPRLAQMVQLLGPADAAGRRRFALSGSY